MGILVEQLNESRFDHGELVVLNGSQIHYEHVFFDPADDGRFVLPHKFFNPIRGKSINPDRDALAGQGE